MFPSIPPVGVPSTAVSPAAISSTAVSPAVASSPVASSPVGPLGSVPLRDLRERIARIERAYGRTAITSVLPFGLAAVDRALPGGGLALAALHEAASSGPDTEHAAAATLFVAGILSRLPVPVLWVQQQPDLFAPGLAGVGLHPDRILFAEAGKSVLAA